MPPDPLLALLVAALEDRERWRLLCEAQREVANVAVATAARLDAECGRLAGEVERLRATTLAVAERLWICSTLLSRVAERRDRRRWPEGEPEYYL